jgi:heme-degrading monooxygenase HmoA
MFSVIFEVNPKQEKFDLYLDLAKGLKPILEGIDGFIDNERFESTRRRGWILSHSTWRDEKSVVGVTSRFAQNRKLSGLG